MTSIEWTHRPGTTGETWNPIRARHRATGRVGWHCTHASDGCRNCYAERQNLNRRGLAFGTGLPYKPGHEQDLDIVLDEKTLMHPLRWRQPRTIFVCSMTDLFGAFVPDAMIDRVLAIAALCPQHTFIVLTKRSARMRDFMSGFTCDGARRYHIADAAGRLMEDGDNAHDSVANAAWPLPNLWLGVSAERQQEADERILDLLATPAAIRFASLEPLLGAVDLRRWLPGCYECAAECGWRSGSPPELEGCHACGWVGKDAGEFCPSCGAQDFTAMCQDCSSHAVHQHPDTTNLSWVIVGGESGPNARPMHPDWARALRDQCAAANVPFFFKQWGEWHPLVDREREDPDWRKDYSVRQNDSRPDIAWLNLAGGRGFHGERFHIMHRLGKPRAGRTLDGVTHDGWPT